MAEKTLNNLPVGGKAKIVQQSLVNGELFKPKDILKVIEEVA